MADSTSDSGSVQSLQTEQTADKKTESTARFYALYSFYPQRIASQTTEGTGTGNPDQEEGSLSLNIVATNLAATAETDLRKLLAQRLLKVTKQTKDGNLFYLRLNSTSDAPVQASCYYCQIEASSESPEFDPVLTDKQLEGASDSQQFVVCLISFQDTSLFLFRSELEQFSHHLVPLLDKELCLPSHQLPSSSDNSSNVASLDQTKEPKELSQLSTGIHGYLRQWPYNVLEYLSRTLQYMGSNIQHLIYSALLNASLQITGATQQQEEDVRRFYKCISLSPFLEQLQADNAAANKISNDNDLWQLKPLVVTVTFLPEQGVTFDKKYICKFCENASETLMSMDANNVTKIRELLESVKLRFIRNMNTLKRFLKQAEIDHYGLYRAFSYLKKCGCGDLLLRYVKLDAETETLSVLTVLETFITSMQITLT